MPRSAAVAVENNFVQGLVTEATGLNFPENAVTETYNCIFSETSEVSRRLGIDFETDHTDLSLDRTDVVVNEFSWKDASVSFLVVQIGKTLHFFRIGSSTNLSSNKLATTINLDTYKVSGAPSTETLPCQFAFGDEKLFVTHPYIDPLYLTYDEDAETFSATQFQLQIRDFKGLDDNLGDTERPNTLSDEHKYNLYNQGWFRGDIEDGDSAFSEDRIQHYEDALGVYPSNSEQWWLYVAPDGDFAPNQMYDRISRGNSRAPRGVFILNPFFEDRSDISGISGFDVVSSGNNRPNCTEFFAGRAFYAGTDYLGYRNTIYFTQILERDDQVGKCYQVNDPTAQDISDLLPSDGGVIKIPDAGLILKMKAVDKTLCIFATNGVWTISGSQGIGFAANDYTVSRISSIHNLSAISFVDVGGSPMWWTSDGIYSITANSQAGSIQVQSLTDKKIKSFFDDIPAESKRYAKGAFNPFDRIVQWVYSAEPAEDIQHQYQYDRILNLNLLSGAFYPWKIEDAVVDQHGEEVVDENGDTVTVTQVHMNGIVVSEGTVTTSTEQNVTDSLGDTVTVSAAAVTVDVVESAGEFSGTFKYLVSYDDSGAKMTFAEENNTDYIDFESYDDEGFDYISYFISGYRVRGDAIKKFQSNWINIFTNNDVNSTFDFQHRWNYAANSNSGMFSGTQTVSHNSTDYSTMFRRLKVRGHGLVCQFKLTSQSGEPFHIIGWTTYDTGNALP